MNAKEIQSVLLAKQLIALYGEWQEGEIESSGDKYKSLINTADGLTISIICHMSPFEYQVLSLYQFHRNREGFDLDLCIDELRRAKYVILKSSYPEEIKKIVRNINLD